MKLINAEKRVKFKDLSKPVKIKRASVLICEGLIALAGLVALIVWLCLGDPHNRMMNCINTAFLTMLLWVFELIIGRRFTFGQHVTYIIFMFFGSFLGSCMYMFESVWFYDELIHAVGGYIICIPLMGLMFIFLKGMEKSGTTISALVILFVSLGTATLWEVIEFTMDVFFAQNGLGYASAEVLEKIKELGLTGIAASWYKVQHVSVFDTITDMSLHTIGTIVFVLHYVIHRLSKKNLLMGFIIKDALSDEMNRKVDAHVVSDEKSIECETEEEKTADETMKQEIKAHEETYIPVDINEKFHNNVINETKTDKIKEDDDTNNSVL